MGNIGSSSAKPKRTKIPIAIGTRLQNDCHFGFAELVADNSPNTDPQKNRDSVLCPRRSGIYASLQLETKKVTKENSRLQNILGFIFNLFISFAPPKEMNQRKRGPKIQPKDFETHGPARTKAQSPSVRTFLGVTAAHFIYYYSINNYMSLILKIPLPGEPAPLRRGARGGFVVRYDGVRV